MKHNSTLRNVFVERQSQKKLLWNSLINQFWNILEIETFIIVRIAIHNQFKNIEAMAIIFTAILISPDGYFSLFCKIPEALIKFKRERQKEHKD